MSKKTLLTLIVTLIFLAIIALFNLSWLKKIYFFQLKTHVGIVINSLIFLIFIIGMVEIVRQLIKYMNEEKDLERFILNCKNRVSDKLMGVNKNSLIAERYFTINKLTEKGIVPDIKILSGFFLTTENSKKGLLEYINNILILTGVFGTVISLIISLIGASGFIKMTDEKSMALIIHGMSTALNTTFTAIICYFVFHYFYLKLIQIQENIALEIEKITYFEILPEFSPTEQKINFEINNTLNEIKNIIAKFSETEEALKEYALKFTKLISLNYEMYKKISEELKQVQKILKEGFRLKD